MKMLNNLASRELLTQLNQKRASEKKSRPCPQCTKGMDYRQAVFNGRQLEVEICPHCRLVWFDSGDLVRSLRHRRDETIETKEERIAEGRVLKSSAAAWPLAKPGADFFPLATVSILVFTALGFTITAGNEALLGQLSFLPGQPWRYFGGTWLTSLFVHGELGSFLKLAIPFFFVSSFVEYRLRAVSTVSLFFVAGVVGRFQSLIGGTARDAATAGLSCGLAGLAVYALLTFPYGQLFFPAQNKWRSPREATSWWIAMAMAVSVFYLGANYLWEGVHGFGMGINTSMYEKTLWGSIGNWLVSNDFKAHLAAAGVGLFWWLGEALDEKRKKT